ncbi:PAS domain S-box protein [Caulobacter sp. FWC2]|uniref:PAS domain-containing sensor histidine kinase n=1 Tax=Caulobacter sp. FWC2 TaxID=69664 RepID=UPI0018ECDF97|nr:PAS domain S-box protein [Caulobacter sp. FWC2]
MPPPLVMPQAAEWPIPDKPQNGYERLSRLPETWKGLDPTAIAESVVETLLDMLELDFAGLRFNDTTHVFLRVAPDFADICSPAEIRAALTRRSDQDASPQQLVLGGQPLSLVQCGLGESVSLGEILAGSRSATFPSAEALAKLRIAASLASLACREMRELSDRPPPPDPRDSAATAQALAESERRLNLTINTIPAMAWSTTPDGLIDFCNQNFVDYVGWTAEAISGQGFWPIFHPDDTDYLVAAWQEIMATKRPRPVECRMRRADGQYRWFVLRQNPLFDADGNVVKWYGVGTDIEDRKRAETALEEAQAALLASERTLSLMLDTIPCMVWSTTAEGHVDTVNKQFCDFVGLSAEDLIEAGFHTQFHPDDVERMFAEWQAMMASRTGGDIEGRARRADGEYRWVICRCGPLLTADGEVVRWYGVNLDIEDRKRAEAAVTASERNLSLILDSLPVLVWSARPDGSADFVNQRFLDYTGSLEETLLEFGFTDRFHPDDVERMLADWSRNLDGEASLMQGRIRRFDGAYRWFLFSGQKLTDASGAVRWFGVNVDIEDLKRTEAALTASEAALRDSERRLQQIVSSIPGLTWSSDANGATTFWSPQYLDYAGVALEDVLGFGFTNFIHPDDRDTTLEQWGEMIATGTSGESELRLRRADGQYRWFLIRASPFFDEDGNLTQWFGVNVDIENRKRAVEDLRQSQSHLAHMTRMTTMGELAVSIAHEVNQPLMAIVTNAGACLRWLDGAQTDIAMARQAAERIVRDGHRAGDIITSLRNLARKTAPRLERVGVEQVIQVVLDLLQGELQRQGVTAKAQLEHSPIIILGDVTQLQQVVLNLIMNAIEAMAGGHEGPKRLTVQARIREGEAIVSVSDTGPGLGSDDPDRLFEAFFSTKAEGIGMGLSICRSIIEAHGGKIWARTNRTQGSVFSFTLPLAEGHGVDVSYG